MVATINKTLYAFRRLDAEAGSLKISLELDIGKSTVGNWKENQLKSNSYVEA